ncbi:MAG: hypothetical protein ABL958_10595 [Bdellovibrionia bacterium]
MKQLKTKGVLLVVGAALVLGFQNCGPDIGLGEGDDDSLGGAPFAYSVSFDRIAYLSCSAANTGTTHFSLKGGAYNTASSGIQFSPEFRAVTRNYVANRKIELANQDDYNRDAQLTVGLRPFDDLKSVTTVNGTNMVKNVLTPLNVSPIVQELANLADGAYLPYTQFPLENAFQLNAANDQTFRDMLTQQSMVMAVTFLEAGQRYASREVDGKIPGSAYHTSFDCGSTPANMHVLCAVEDYELMSGGSGGQWDCPADFHYKVIRNGDAGTAGCNFGSPQTNNPEYIELRRILGPNWQIDIGANCIQPTQGSCYPNTVTSVDYNLGTNCDGAGQPACVRHFSLCLKDN